MITTGASHRTVLAVQYGLEEISQEPALLAPQQMTWLEDNPENRAMIQANAEPTRVNPVNHIGNRLKNFMP
jgi:hypothetical protein